MLTYDGMKTGRAGMTPFQMTLLDGCCESEGSKKRTQPDQTTNTHYLKKHFHAEIIAFEYVFVATNILVTKVKRLNNTDFLRLIT